MLEYENSNLLEMLFNILKFNILKIGGLKFYKKSLLDDPVFSYGRNKKFICVKIP